MKVVFMPENKVAEVTKGSTLLDVAKELGVLIESPCGGNYMCGKCKVLVSRGNDGVLLPEELHFLTEEEIKRGIRLACCCKVTQDMTVLVPRKAPIPLAKRMEERRTGLQNEKSLGVAIDVGTTTIEAHIIDLASFHIKKKVKFYNPQIAYGADVIARITYAAGNPKREEALKNVLVSAINTQVIEAIEELGGKETDIKKVTMVGNTTMSYILTGVSLSYLAKAPFSLVYKGNKQYQAEELGIFSGSKANIYVGPNIGGHVGSDAFSCLVAADLMRKKGCYILADIGTNGEILLVNNGTVYACSTAAGPAFEGAGLSCGMRADAGAITKAAVKDKTLVCQTEGNTAPIGISGSGIIDVLAGMLALGIMEETGYIKEGCCKEQGFEVASGVFVAREDVRQIQLAKAAIHSGIRVLLQTAGILAEDVDQWYLAGAFGSNINIVNAMRIGLLPTVPISKVQYVGNAAVMGAKEFLRRFEQAEEFEAWTKKITHVELANREGFQELFIQSINFDGNLS